MVPPMRRFVPFAALLVAGCATTPDRPQPGPVEPVTPAPQARSDLNGLTAAELVQRFGSPALQIREGAGLKLQFRGPACILDAYLYPPSGGGAERVAHVDARIRSGADTSQPACIAALQRR